MSLEDDYYKHALNKQHANALSESITTSLGHRKLNISVCQNLQYEAFKRYGFVRIDQLFEVKVKERLDYYLSYLENLSGYKNGYESAVADLRTFVDTVTRECNILRKKHPIGFWDRLFGYSTKYLYHDNLKYIVEQLNLVSKKLPNSQPPKKR